MGSEELAKSVVSSLSHYLVRRAQVGNAAYNAELENLLGQVESVLSDPYSAEMFARFVANPADSVEADTLRLHLAWLVVCGSSRLTNSSLGIANDRKPSSVCGR